MQIVQPQHDLIDYVSCISFRELFHFGQSSKKLTAFEQFWYNVVVLIIFNQFNDPYYIRMTFLKQYLEFILK